MASQNNCRVRKADVWWSNLFYLFFCGQILSPSIASVTVYLEVLIAIANPFFRQWISRRCRGEYLLCGLFLVGFLIISENYVLAVKALVLAASVSYVQYSRLYGVFYLYRYLGLSVILAIFQFSALFIDDSLAYAIGPSSIAEVIWGNYATGTYTNFYTIFAFERVSGLSREAGFFASLVINCIVIYYIDRGGRCKNSRWLMLILLVGFILSFSKMSLLLVPAVIIVRCRKWIDRVPFALVPTVFSLGLMILWKSQIDFLYDDANGTFLQRFGGYAGIFDLDIRQIIIGIKSLHELDSQVARVALSAEWENMDYFAGFAGYILAHGVPFTMLTLGVLWSLGMSSTGILLVLLLTANVDLMTNQNFVTLTYFIAFFLIQRKKVTVLRAVVESRLGPRSVELSHAETTDRTGPPEQASAAVARAYKAALRLGNEFR